MAGVVIRTPEKKPTPNAIIANIAKKRPKDCFISLNVVLLIILFMYLTTSFVLYHTINTSSASKLVPHANGADRATTRFIR